MTVTVTPMVGTLFSNLILHETGTSLSEREVEVLNFCQSISGELWNGFIDGEFICSWGLIPPTVFSTQAYLWMYTSDAVRKHQFLFVRRSQIIVEDMLTRYESLVGHCIRNSRQSQRWLKWLGAEFGAPQGEVVPFTIRRRSRG